MAKRFIPHGAVTGIGSLPHTSARDAVHFVAEHCPEIPFWPQLPQRVPEELMLMQPFAFQRAFFEEPLSAWPLHILPRRLDPFLRQLVDRGAMLEASGAEGFFAFQRWFQGVSTERPRAIKGQQVGPVTVLSGIHYGHEPLAALSEARAVICRYLLRLAIWQVEQLRALSETVLFFFDDPLPGVVDVAAVRSEGLEHAVEALQQMIAAVQSAGSICGVHSCARMRGTFSATLGFDLVSFDAISAQHGPHKSEEGEFLFTQRDFVDFISAGGLIGLGIIPTDHSLADFRAELAVKALLRACERAGLDMEVLIRQSLVTATCGLGLLDLGRASRSFEAARDVSNLLRAHLREWSGPSL